MPCNMGDGELASVTGHDQKEAKDALRVAIEVKKQADVLTNILCTLMRSLTAEQIAKLDPEAQDWFQRHIEYDKTQGR